MSFSGVLPGSDLQSSEVVVLSTRETLGNVIGSPVKLLRFFPKFFFHSLIYGDFFSAWTYCKCKSRQSYK